MGKIAFIFPGQGSQIVGMGKDAALQFASVNDVFSKADEVLKTSLSSIIFNGPQEELTLTTNAQPAILTTSYAFLEKLKEANISPDYVAGHSLGEYTALVAAGAISFEDAVYTVRKRGEFMEEAVPTGNGAMAAVLGMDKESLNSITEEVTGLGYPVQIANSNSPGQLVISGSTNGIKTASEIAKAKGAKRVIPLEVSGPFHSSLMEPAAESLAQVLDEITINDANISVIANVTAKTMTSADDIKTKLIKQLYSPVLWQESVTEMIHLGVDTFVEIGPGKVLSGLIKKIDRNVTIYAVHDVASLESTISAFKEVQ